MATLQACTVDPGGTGDYTSLNAAEAANFGLGSTAGDFVTQNKYIECTCKCTNGNADTSNVIVSGQTTDSSHYIQIQVDSAYRHSGTFPSSGNVYRLQVANGNPAFKSFTSWIKLYDMAAQVTASADYTSAIWFKSKSCEAQRCVAKLIDDSSYIYCAPFYLQNYTNASTGWHKVANCIGYGADQKSDHAAFIVSGDLVTAYIYNCTAVKSYNAVLGRYGTTVVKGVLGYGTTAGFALEGTAAWAAACTNNASDQNDAPGSSAIDLSGVASGDLFKDYANDDFHIVSGAAVEGVGVDLSGDSDLAVSDDIDDRERKYYFDVGADQLFRVFGGATLPALTVSGGLDWNFVLSGSFSLPLMSVSGALSYTSTSTATATAVVRKKRVFMLRYR